MHKNAGKYVKGMNKGHKEIGKKGATHQSETYGLRADHRIGASWPAPKPKGNSK